MNADVILPVSSSTPMRWTLSMVAMRTLHANTPGVRIIVIDTTREPSDLRVRNECRALGVEYLEWKQEFSITKIFNMAQEIGDGKYVVFATADTIFYPDWLMNLVKIWDENPQYFCLAPCTFDPRGNPCSMQTVKSQWKIVETAHPSAGVIVFRRDNLFQWDEQFPLWECDSDLTLYMERNGLKAGYCLNSRVDHLINGFDTPHDPLARRKLEAKWNLPRPKEECGA